MNSVREPSPGWIEGMQGYVGVIFGIGYGIVRLMMLNLKTRCQGVPVDYCANVAVAAGWQVAKKPHTDHRTENKAPPIYSLSVDKSNSRSLGDAFEWGVKQHNAMPNTKMIWFPFIHTTTCPFLYKLGLYLYHLIPAFFFDLALRLAGKKPVMLKIYKKIHDNILIFKPFCTKNFNFDSTNTKQLWRSMSSEDQQVFGFDMASLNWDKYIKTTVDGIRIHMYKDPMTPESIATGKRLLNR